MFLWYICLSVAGVALVFQSRGIDYRLVAVGSLLPLVLDIPFGYRAYGYTLLFAVVLLALAMVVTIGRPRLLRRRLLCLPIGVFAGLVLSGAFTNSELFWWPFLGTTFAHDALLPGRGGSWARRSSGWSWAGSSSASTTSTCPSPVASSFRTGRLTSSS